MESNILFALLVRTNRLEHPYKGMHIRVSLNVNKDYLQRSLRASLSLMYFY